MPSSKSNTKSAAKEQEVCSESATKENGEGVSGEASGSELGRIMNLSTRNDNDDSDSSSSTSTLMSDDYNDSDSDDDVKEEDYRDDEVKEPQSSAADGRFVLGEIVSKNLPMIYARTPRNEPTLHASKPSDLLKKTMYEARVRELEEDKRKETDAKKKSAEKKKSHLPVMGERKAHRAIPGTLHPSDSFKSVNSLASDDEEKRKQIASEGRKIEEEIKASDKEFFDKRGVSVDDWLENAQRKRLEIVDEKDNDDVFSDFEGSRKRSNSADFKTAVLISEEEQLRFLRGCKEIISKIRALTPSTNGVKKRENEVVPGPSNARKALSSTLGGEGLEQRIHSGSNVPRRMPKLKRKQSIADIQLSASGELMNQELGMDEYKIDEANEGLAGKLTDSDAEGFFFAKRREALVPEDWKTPPSTEIPRCGCSKEFLSFMNDKVLQVIDCVPVDESMDVLRYHISAIVFCYFQYNIPHTLIQNLGNYFDTPLADSPSSGVPAKIRRIRICRMVLFIAKAAGHWKISWHLLASFLSFFDKYCDIFDAYFINETFRRIITNWNVPEQWLGLNLKKPSLIWRKLLAYLSQAEDTLEWDISDDNFEMFFFQKPLDDSSLLSSQKTGSGKQAESSPFQTSSEVWLEESLSKNKGNGRTISLKDVQKVLLSRSPSVRCFTSRHRFNAAVFIRDIYTDLTSLSPELLEIACRSTSYSATEPKSLRHREFRDKFNGTALLEHICKALNVFPDTVISCANAMISKNHIQGVKNEKSFVATSSFFFPPRPGSDDFLDLEKFPPSTFKSKPGVEPTFLDIDVVELAQQITLYEQTMFKDLRLCEFFSGKMSDTDGNVRNKVCPNATLIAEFQNRMQSWVLTTIVTSKNISTGAKTLQRMILLAHELMKMHNFSASNSIVMCLTQFNLEVNLPRTYKKISGEARELLKSMKEDLRNPTALFENAHAPKIPSFFRFSADSTKIIDHCKEEAGDDKIRREWAPFEAGTRFARLVIDSQSRMYPFKYNSDIQHYLRNLKSKGFGEIGRLADQLEGKK